MSEMTKEILVWSGVALWGASIASLAVGMYAVHSYRNEWLAGRAGLREHIKAGMAARHAGIVSRVLAILGTLLVLARHLCS